MSTFLLVFGLFMLGMCAIVSSPVPTGKGKRIFLFIVGVALWVGALILVRSQEEALLVFFFSDWALSGGLANQVAATLVAFGFGWYTFVLTSVRTERQEPTSFELLWTNSQQSKEVKIVKVFRPWPSLLVWIPVVALLGVVWIVPVHFAGVELKPTATATPTRTPWSTNTPTQTPTATVTPLATQTSTPTAMPTNTPTNTPEPTATQVTISTNPNMPPLACGGEWLHAEPFKIGAIRQALEQCPNGAILLHYPDNKTDPQLFQGMTIMMTSAPFSLEFTIEEGGEVYVNGAPFSQWLESQGGN